MNLKVLFIIPAIDAQIKTIYTKISYYICALCLYLFQSEF